MKAASAPRRNTICLTSCGGSRYPKSMAARAAQIARNANAYTHAALSFRPRIPQQIITFVQGFVDLSQMPRRFGRTSLGRNGQL
jgi:hypothetical protein